MNQILIQTAKLLKKNTKGHYKLFSTLYIAPLFLLLCFSCGTPDYETVEFNGEIRMVGEEILTDEFSTIAVRVVEDTLLIVERTEPPFFSVYCKNTLQQITEFGNKGKAPSEFILPLIYSTPENTELTKENIWIVDILKQRAYTINLKGLIDGNSMEIISVEKIPKEHIPRLWVFLNENQRLCCDYFFEWSIYDIRTNEFSYRNYREYLQKIRIKNKDYLKDFLGQTSTYNLSINRAASIHENLPLVDIYMLKDAEGEYSIEHKITVATGPMPNRIHDTHFENQDYILYNAHASSSNDNIYILNLNQPSYDYQEKPIGSNILVLDWEGRPKLRLKVDEYLHFIASDQNNKYLYGIDYTEDKVYRYKLPVMEKNLTQN